MTLIYAGIDEAGYGPMLGPLCVSMVILRVERWTPGDPPPDLWAALAKAVARHPTPGRIPIADSKALKLSNQGKRHPLTHLERGCLAFAHAHAGSSPATDSALLEVLGTPWPEGPWYGGEPCSLPLATSADAIAIDANLLAGALREAGVRVERLACHIVPESRFNELARVGGKAATTLSAIQAHLRTLLDHHADAPIRLVCDRLGGRTQYAGALAQLLPGAEIAIVDEGPRASAYDLTSEGRSCRVLFQTEAEGAHMPVALASMLAKLVRELAMQRFNRYWSARVDGLKPTAGYVTDARRWLAQAGPAVTPRERAAMVRQA